MVSSVNDYGWIKPTYRHSTPGRKNNLKGDNDLLMTQSITKTNLKMRQKRIKQNSYLQPVQSGLEATELSGQLTEQTN